jgi:hypothetical protein
MVCAKRLFPVFLLGSVAGCGEPAGAPQPRPTPTSGYTTEALSGEVIARIAPPGEPTATLRSGPGVPLRLPPGFSLYPGAMVTSSTVVERAGRERTLLVFETPDPLPAVTSYYRGRARDAGAELTLDLPGEARASLGGVLSSGRTFAFSGRREGSRTRAELSFD